MAAALPPVIVDASVTLTWGAAGQYYGYCTIADVEYEFADPDAFMTLTASVRGQEITNAAMEMQETLDYVYRMPYTGANTGILLTLRQMNAKLAFANIMERYFTASAPNASAAALERRMWVSGLLHSLVNGHIRWDDPFGDAVAQGQLPVYQTSSGASITPSPDSGDASAKPIFSIGRSRYRRDVM